MQVAIAAPFVPVGVIKSFGAFGEEYKVGQPLRPLENGDWMVAITLIKTGEVTEYKLSHIIDDHEAR
jgi:hypothetical protein